MHKKLRRFAQQAPSLADTVLRGGLVTNQPAPQKAAPAQAQGAAPAAPSLITPQSATPIVLMSLRNQAAKASTELSQVQSALQTAASKANTDYSNATVAMNEYRQSYANQIKMLAQIDTEAKQKKEERAQLEAKIQAAQKAETDAAAKAKAQQATAKPATNPGTAAGVAAGQAAGSVAGVTTPTTPPPATQPATKTPTSNHSSASYRFAQDANTPPPISQLPPPQIGANAQPSATTTPTQTPVPANATADPATPATPEVPATLAQLQQQLAEMDKAYQAWWTQTSASKQAYDEQVTQAYQASEQAMQTFEESKNAYSTATTAFQTTYQKIGALQDQLEQYATDPDGVEQDLA